MKDFFANIAIGGAGLAAFLTLLDWFLTDKQKEHLSIFSIRLWNWLDDVHKRRFLEWFYRGRPQLVIAVLSLISYLLFFVSYLLFFGAFPPSFVATLIIGMSLAVGVFRPLLRWLSASKGQLTYLSRLYAVIAAHVLLTMIFWYLGSSWVETISEIIPGWAETPWFICGLSVVVAHGAFTMLWLFLFSATLCLFFAKILVHAWTIIMRRVAESEKGPLLGISALVGGIAAVVKAMQ